MACAEDTPGEDVFNLEVAEDESYVAEGFVVHNCDLHARANLHGLGPGVYPLNAHPWPAHPSTLSFLQSVFVDEISDEDREGQETAFEWINKQPADRQDAVVGGKRKGAAFRAGELQPSELRLPWYMVAERLGVEP